MDVEVTAGGEEDTKAVEEVQPEKSVEDALQIEGKPTKNHTLLGTSGHKNIGIIIEYWFRVTTKRETHRINFMGDIIPPTIAYFSSNPSTIINAEEYNILEQWLSKAIEAAAGKDPLTYKTKNGEVTIEYPKSFTDLNLLFRASDEHHDGWQLSTWHKLCDGHYPTVTIIQTNHGNVTGGFTFLPWGTPKDSSMDFLNDEYAFLFVLRRGADVEKELPLPDLKIPIQFPIQSSGATAVCHYYNFGPRFGGGADLYLVNKCNESDSNYAEFGSSYVCPESLKEHRRELLAGKYNFRVVDYECFELLQ